MLKSVANVIRRFSNQIEAGLPPHGYETLMDRPKSKGFETILKIRRQEETGKDSLPKPGETIEVYENGEWKTIKWPGSKK